MKVFNYILSKITGIIVLFLAGTLVVFILSKHVADDNIDIKLGRMGVLAENNERYFIEYEKLYIKEGENLPLFYFSFLPSTYHPNIRSITNKIKRTEIIVAQRNGYNCSKISNDTDVKDLNKASYYFPVFIYHGTNNQYHKYMHALLSGTWGVSNQDGKQIWTKISTSLNWTLAIVFLNLLFSITISFLLAFFMIKKDGSKLDTITQSVLLVIYSIPGFWLATLVLIFFTGYDYGMPIFKTPLYLPLIDQNFVTILTQAFSKIAPVVFCLTLADVAYLTRILKSNLKKELSEPYVLSLKSRGLSANKILIRHALPNSMLPIITLIANGIPTALAGSLIFEVVFNISGMGRLLYDSIKLTDWNVVYTIVVVLLVITAISFSIGDVLYRIADPRIKNSAPA